MSIHSKYLRILFDGGKSTQDAIECATAMERGDDRDEMFYLVEPLVASGVSAPEIAEAMCSLACEINERNRAGMAFYQRTTPSAPDPYKQRLGLSKGAWRRLRNSIFERDGMKCQYCGATEDLAVDHIIPLSRGGTNDPDNLTPACKPCNSSKKDKLVQEWLGNGH